MALRWNGTGWASDGPPLARSYADAAARAKEAAPMPAVEQQAGAQYAPPERKMYYLGDVGAAIRLGALVHGPGASELLGYATGHGQDANSAVFACLTAICTAFIEARPRVYRRAVDAGTPEVVADHPLELLLNEAPNPNLTGAELWWWQQWARHVHGNAYWRKVRAGSRVGSGGNVIELWPVSPTHIAPVTTKQDRLRGIFISHYKWEYETGKYLDLPVEDVVHFRYGLDDYDHRLGISPLRRLIRHIDSDDAANRFAAALLSNYAVPGMVVTTEGELSQEDADEVKQKLSTKFGSGNQGNVAVLTNGMTAEAFGFSPKDLDLASLSRIHEERIAAVMRVPAIIAGLGAGLARSTYANFREAREMFAETTILPLYTADAATLNRQLKPDFTSDRGLFVQWDTTDLRALQEDEDKKYARLSLGVEKKWIKRNEARVDVGLPPVPGWDEEDEAPPAEMQAPPEGPDGGDGQPRASATEQPRSSGGGGQRALPPPSRNEQRGRRVGGYGRKARPRAEDFPDLLEAMRELAEPAFRETLGDYFEEQRQRITNRLLADVFDSGTADPATARAALPRVAR